MFIEFVQKPCKGLKHCYSGSEMKSSSNVFGGNLGSRVRIPAEGQNSMSFCHSRCPTMKSTNICLCVDETKWSQIY